MLRTMLFLLFFLHLPRSTVLQPVRFPVPPCDTGRSCHGKRAQLAQGTYTHHNSRTPCEHHQRQLTELIHALPGARQAPGPALPAQGTRAGPALSRWCSRAAGSCRAHRGPSAHRGVLPRGRSPPHTCAVPWASVLPVLLSLWPCAVSPGRALSPWVGDCPLGPSLSPRVRHCPPGPALSPQIGHCPPGPPHVCPHRPVRSRATLPETAAARGVPGAAERFCRSTRCPSAGGWRWLRAARTGNGNRDPAPLSVFRDKLLSCELCESPR